MADPDALAQLHQRLLSDDALRAEFRQAPHDVLENNGISLTDAQREKLSALNLHMQSDEQVRAALETEGLQSWF